MGFSYPLFLWMLAALAVPIVVHLLKFRPRQTLYFSDIRFLKETASTQARMHKLRDILLLLLRLLAIACLVLGFSMPFIKKEGLASVENEDGSEIYLFVDASLSMDAQEEEGNTWNGMFRSLNAWLSSATQDKSLFISDASGYFSAAHSPSQAWKMLSGMEPHIGAASPLSVYQKWKNEGSKGQLIMISDLQRNQWEELFQDSVHSRVMILPVEHSSDQRNLSIDSVWAEVPFTRPGLEQRLQVQVRNHSSKPVSSTLELLQDRRVENFESIELDAGAVEILSLNFIPGGSGHAQLQLTDRSWRFDNIFHIAWNQGQIPHVLIYDNGQAETDWPRIFPETEFESVLWKDKTEDAAGTTADLIVLADWTPGSGLMERVEQMAQSGADLVIWPSKTGAYPRFLSSLSNWGDGQDSGRFRGDLIDKENALFRSVFSRIPENPALPVDRKRNLLQATNGWRGMIQYEDGYLQLAQRQMGSSSILLFASALSPEWSHWAQEDLTLPLLHQASWRTQASNSLELKARPAASWTLPHPNGKMEQAIRAVDNSGRTFVPGQRRMAGSTQIVFGPEFSQPGVYALVDDQDSLGLLAVNPSFEERDLRFFDRAELPAEWQSQLVEWEELELFGAASKESDLWVILLGLGLLFLLIEGVVPKFAQPKSSQTE
jgi:hypothetical protein